MLHGYGYVYQYRKDTDTRIWQFPKQSDTRICLLFKKYNNNYNNNNNNNNNNNAGLTTIVLGKPTAHLSTICVPVPCPIDWQPIRV